MAYTYSEPSVWYEFVFDTAYLAKEAGLKNVLVTNGFINPKPLAELLPLVDAMNIDVKGFTDAEEEIDRLSQWLASVDKTIPLHLTRFFPNFELTDVEPTPLETLERAREIALEKLDYVYTGNAWGSTGSHTYCPRCKKMVIERGPRGVRGVGLEGKQCNKCGAEIKLYGELKNGAVTKLKL